MVRKEGLEPSNERFLLRYPLGCSATVLLESLSPIGIYQPRFTSLLYAGDHPVCLPIPPSPHTYQVLC